MSGNSSPTRSTFEVSMKIVLIPNPVLKEGRPFPYVPLGILSLATVLKNDGFDAEIIDCNAICSDRTYQELPEAIAQLEPDVVGFSTWCNYYADLTRFSALLHEKLPHVKIIFGGVQATHCDRETVETFPQVDVVARGECDNTISDIVSAIHDPDRLSKVKGVTFMRRGRLVRTPDQGPVRDLSSLPLPDYSLLPFLGKMDQIAVDVGRGCPFKCAYCVSNSMAEGKFRQRPVSDVIKIVRAIIEQYGKTCFRFEHDMLTLNRKWLLNLCDSLGDEGLDITWECFSRIDTTDDELIERMAGAGCKYIYFGVETGSPRMQKLLNKRLKLDDAPAVVRKVCDARMVSGTGIILGFPQEELSDVAHTMRLTLEIYFSGERGISDVFIWLLVPFRGSPLFEQYGHRLAIDEHLSNFAVSPATLVDTELVRKNPSVFPSLYYFVPEHVERDVFVKVVYIMTHLLSLRYTALALLKDPGFGYPDSLLKRIGELRLPHGNIFSHSGSKESLSAVADFIADTVNGLGFGDHYIYDLLRFDLAFNAPTREGNAGHAPVIEAFAYDVMAFVQEVKSNGFRSLPDNVPRTGCSVLFRMQPDGMVDCIRLPEAFKAARS